MNFVLESWNFDMWCVTDSYKTFVIAILADFLQKMIYRQFFEKSQFVALIRPHRVGSAEIHSSNALLLKLVFTLRRYLAFSRVASLLKRIFPTTTTTSTSRCILDKRLWQQKFSFHKKIFFRPPQKFAKLAQSMWQCGSVAVWQCGSVAVWQCGSVAS